ncbi:hypothetical protein [Rhizobium fabae]|uniref:Uncharacterized protein n=1 Tax=Rhizobium fabae TaxID=573179 RepID=A0A7W6BBI7_9HYPH|nr:hypothetical protein [Rhizobium fabae]MBB3919195.1 hypothetical protein [Rhizobium fabae]RUM16486.1 hypothetical protein EFB14_00085 [Rhizobium fabae]
MAKNDSENSYRNSVREKFAKLIQLVGSSATAAVLMGLIAGAGGDIATRFWKPEQVTVWQLSGTDQKALLARLEKSQGDAAVLRQIVSDNPKATQLVETLTADISATKELLQSLPYIERRASLNLIPDVFSAAHAQQAATTPPAEDHSPNMFLYLILALVAFVLVVFCLMYVFTKDKTKTAFAEKMISTIIGFALGMLTGSNAGKLK